MHNGRQRNNWQFWVKPFEGVIWWFKALGVLWILLGRWLTAILVRTWVSTCYLCLRDVSLLIIVKFKSKVWRKIHFSFSDSSLFDSSNNGVDTKDMKTNYIFIYNILKMSYWDKNKNNKKNLDRVPIWLEKVASGLGNQTNKIWLAPENISWLDN